MSRLLGVVLGLSLGLAGGHRCLAGGPAEEEATFGGKTVGQWIKALEDPDDFVRMQAAGALGSIGPAARAAVPALVEALRGDGMLRCSAALALRRIGGEAEAAVPALLDLLRDPSYRATAAQVLGGIGPRARAALPALRKGLADESGDVRAAVAWALWRVEGRTEDVLPVLEGLLRDKDPDARTSAAGVLAEMGAAGSRALLRALRAPDAQVRLETAGALIYLTGHGQAVLPVLVELLGQKDTEVRCGAMSALAAMGLEAKPAVPALTAAAREKGDVGDLAARLLERIQVLDSLNAPDETESNVTRKDRERLQGCWAPVRLCVEGREMPEEVLRQTRYVVRGNRMIVTAPPHGHLGQRRSNGDHRGAAGAGPRTDLPAQRGRAPEDD